MPLIAMFPTLEDLTEFILKLQPINGQRMYSGIDKIRPSQSTDHSLGIRDCNISAYGVKSILELEYLTCLTILDLARTDFVCEVVNRSEQTQRSSSISVHILLKHQSCQGSLLYLVHFCEKPSSNLRRLAWGSGTFTHAYRDAKA